MPTLLPSLQAALMRAADTAPLKDQLRCCVNRELTCAQRLICMLMVLTAHEKTWCCLKMCASLDGRGAVKRSRCSGTATSRKMKAERSPDSNAERVERWTELAEVCLDWWRRLHKRPCITELNDE